MNESGDPKIRLWDGSRSLKMAQLNSTHVVFFVSNVYVAVQFKCAQKGATSYHLANGCGSQNF